jgi:hypothetical protein
MGFQKTKPGRTQTVAVSSFNSVQIFLSYNF